MLHCDEYEQVCTPQSTKFTRELEANTKSRRRVLTTTALVGLCYFTVSGGPFGSEQIVSAGGPLVGLIGIVVMPLIWSIPTSFITTELSIVYPANGGYIIWILHSFGPFWAFQTGYWAWLSGVIDNALYPALALSTYTNVYGELNSSIANYFIKAAIALIFSLPNFLGLKIVGNGMATGFIFVILPFAVMVIWGFATAKDWGALLEVRRSNLQLDDQKNLISMSGGIDIDWSTLIQTLYWNFNGFMAASVYGGDVVQPERTYPRAMLISVFAVFLTYALPLTASSAFNHPHWSDWEEGSYSAIAKAIGGEILANWILVSTVLSNAGLYIAELCCDSYQLAGMAEAGLAPKIFASRNARFDTPHWSIASSVAVILVLISFTFDAILSMTNALSAFVGFAIITSFIRLRFTHKDTDRPVKVPGPLPVLIAFLTLPLALMVYIAQDVFHSLIPSILVALVLLIGLVYGKYKNFSYDQVEQLAVDENIL